MTSPKIDYLDPSTMPIDEILDDLSYYRDQRIYPPDRYPKIRRYLPIASERALVAELLRRRTGEQR